MANLPDDLEPVKVSYTYADGRVFSVEGQELETFLTAIKNTAMIAFTHELFECGTIDWTVEYPAHDGRP